VASLPFTPAWSLGLARGPEGPERGKGTHPGTKGWQPSAACFSPPIAQLRRLLAFWRCWCSSHLGGQPNCPATGCPASRLPRPVDSPIKPPRTAPRRFVRRGAPGGGPLVSFCAGGFFGPQDSPSSLHTSPWLFGALDVSAMVPLNQTIRRCLTLPVDCWPAELVYPEQAFCLTLDRQQWPVLWPMAAGLELHWLSGGSRAVACPATEPSWPFTVRRLPMWQAWRWRAGACPSEKWAAQPAGSQAR